MAGALHSCHRLSPSLQPQAGSQPPAGLPQTGALAGPPPASGRPLFLPGSHTLIPTRALLLEDLRAPQGSSHLCPSRPQAAPRLVPLPRRQQGRAGGAQPLSAQGTGHRHDSGPWGEQGMKVRIEMRHPRCQSLAAGILARQRGSGPLPPRPLPAASPSSSPASGTEMLLPLLLLQAGGWALLPASGGAAPPPRRCPPLSSPPAAFMSVFKRRRSEGWAHVAAAACSPLSPAPARPRSPSAPRSPLSAAVAWRAEVSTARHGTEPSGVRGRLRFPSPAVRRGSGAAGREGAGCLGGFLPPGARLPAGRGSPAHREAAPRETIASAGYEPPMCFISAVG